MRCEKGERREGNVTQSTTKIYKGEQKWEVEKQKPKISSTVSDV